MSKTAKDLLIQTVEDILASKQPAMVQKAELIDKPVDLIKLSKGAEYTIDEIIAGGVNSLEARINMYLSTANAWTIQGLAVHLGLTLKEIKNPERLFDKHRQHPDCFQLVRMIHIARELIEEQLSMGLFTPASSGVKYMLENSSDNWVSKKLEKVEIEQKVVIVDDIPD